MLQLLKLHLGKAKLRFWSKNQNTHKEKTFSHMEFSKVTFKRNIWCCSKLGSPKCLYIVLVTSVRFPAYRDQTPFLTVKLRCSLLVIKVKCCWDLQDRSDFQERTYSDTYRVSGPLHHTLLLLSDCPEPCLLQVSFGAPEILQSSGWYRRTRVYQPASPGQTVIFTVLKGGLFKNAQDLYWSQ